MKDDGPHNIHSTLPIIGQPSTFRRKTAAPGWLWLIFWIVVTPIILWLIYWGKIWIIFVIAMACCSYILKNCKKKR